MDVRKIAKLAHLEITDAEVEMYTPQMDDIVKYIEQLNELDTDDVEPMLGGLTAEGEATSTIQGRCHRPARLDKRRLSIRLRPLSQGISRCQRFCRECRTQNARCIELLLSFCILHCIFALAACSLPNLEKPQCTEARDSVKQFYSLHLASDCR